MSHRPIYQIEEERSHMRFSIQRLMDDYMNLTEELERAQAWRDFINGEDQRCYRCGGLLGKRRVGGTKWLCPNCKKK